MSSISVTRSDHDITFHVHETKPYWYPDVDRTITIPFDTAHTIPVYFARTPPYGYERIECFWIAERQEWIGFIFTSYREKSYGPNEEDYDGPYALGDLLPPPAGTQDLQRRIIEEWPWTEQDSNARTFVA